MSSKYKKLTQRFLGNIVRVRFGWKKQLTKVLKFFYFLVSFVIEIVGDVLFIWKRHSLGIALLENPKILIVKIDQFGDVLFSTFLIPLIKKQYPNARIDYVVNPKTEVLLQKNPHIERVFHWDDIALRFVLGREKSVSRKSFLSAIVGIIKTVRAIRRERYDVVINTRAYIPSSNIWWKLVCPKQLIAFDISEHSFLVDRTVSYDFYAEEWVNYLKLIEPLIDIARADFAPEFYHYAQTEIPTERFVVVAPVSFDVERQWDKEKWRNLIARLRLRGFSVVLSGITSHTAYLKKISEGFEEDGGVLIRTDLSIPQLAYMTRKSELVIGIDSFPMHLGLAVGKHIVCVVNERAYYVPHLSKKLWSIDARCMIPQTPFSHIYSITASVQEVIDDLEKNELLA